VVLGEGLGHGFYSRPRRGDEDGRGGDLIGALALRGDVAGDGEVGKGFWERGEVSSSFGRARSGRRQRKTTTTATGRTVAELVAARRGRNWRVKVLERVRVDAAELVGLPGRA
jgi:hypothetical protein